MSVVLLVSSIFLKKNSEIAFVSFQRSPLIPLMALVGQPSGIFRNHMFLQNKIANLSFFPSCSYSGKIKKEPNLNTCKQYRCCQVKFKDNFLLKKKCGPAPVVHTCNPSYLGSKDQEDLGSKPAQANSLRYSISKNPSQKKGWWSGSRCRP
jgi:hypothetical protein